MQVKITDIVIDQTVQLRKRWLDQSTVQRYVEALAAGAEFPPVIAFRDNGTLVLADGFHRLAAYQFVGFAEVEVDVKDGNREDAMIYAATANVTNGKPMSQAERREAGKRLLKMTDWSDSEIARKLSMSSETVRQWRIKLVSSNFLEDSTTRTVTRNGTTYKMNTGNIGKGSADEPDDEPVAHLRDIQNDNDAGVNPGDIFGYVNDPQLPAKLPDEIRLITGDFAEIARQLEPGCFTAIITDPPYAQEYLHLYGLLAEQAARLLKPGGNLLAMCGQSYLPEVLNLMTPHLNYHWMLSYDTPGGQSPQIWQRKVNTFWKPILWFVNGEYDGAWRGDKIKSDVNDNDKRFHGWGQSESGIGRLVSEFAFTGRVLDPFVGGGTVGVVCYRLHKPFTGIDIDPEAIEMTRNRILAEMANG